jgi:glycosyltransferase involved in cell wall biosynthesis
MKVLLSTIFKYPQTGGVSTYITNLATGLKKKGIEVEVLSISDTKKYFTNEDWALCDEHYKNLYGNFSNEVPDTALKWEIFRYLFEKLIGKINSEYDVIHTNDVFTIDLLKERYKNTPVLVTPHASLVEECLLEGFCNEGDLLLEYAEYNNKKVFEADGIIGISEYIINRLCKTIPENKLDLIHTGIPTTTTNTSLPNTSLNKVPIISTVTRLVPIKGIETLLKALKVVEEKGYEFECNIIGEGHLKENLIELTNILGLKKVKFLGKKENVFSYLNKTDIFVLPSKSENLPIALIEAMFSNCAIIASNVGGVSEIIEDGVEGELFECNSIEQLSDSISRLIKNKNLRESYASSALKRARKELTLEEMTSKIINVYNQYLR